MKFNGDTNNFKNEARDQLGSTNLMNAGTFMNGTLSVEEG